MSSLASWGAEAIALAEQTLADPVQVTAIVSAGIAGGLTLASSFVKTMVPLRLLAVGSNIGFLMFGLLHPSTVMALLQGSLLPINLYRSIEMIRLTRRVRAAGIDTETLGVWLKPYMKSNRRPAGFVLFEKGDAAEHLYLLADGQVEFPEIATSIGPGRMFGEIAFFSPERKRTLSARCAEPSTVLSIDQSTVKQLYYQNPAFGFELIGLVAARLSADVGRLQKQLAET